MKKNRQHKILELISRYEITTQDELIEHLEREGFNVTQATVSRDIRELDIVKVSTGKGTYKYTASHTEHAGRRSASLANALVDCVISITAAQNIIVLKTVPGMSDAVAVAIDRIDEKRILGCVSGDDTIIVVVTDTDTACEISVSLKRLLAQI